MACRIANSERGSMMGRSLPTALGDIHIAFPCICSSSPYLLINTRTYVYARSYTRTHTLVRTSRSGRGEGARVTRHGRSYKGHAAERRRREGQGHLRLQPYICNRIHSWHRRWLMGTFPGSA